MGHQPDAVLRDVIQTSDEGRDIGGARLGGQQRLPYGKDQRAVGADPAVGKIAHGPNAVGRTGQLHDDVRVEPGQLGTLAHHPFEIRGDHLGAHIAVHDPTDLHIVAAARLFAPDVLLGHQRRVGRHPVEHSHFIGLADLREIRRVDEKFHVSSFGLVSERYEKCSIPVSTRAGFFCRTPSEEKKMQAA